MLGQIWKILTTLTEEAQNAAVSKCEEKGFEKNRGLIPLSESLMNLNSARLILRDAIEKKKLINLPITVQKTIHALLAEIAELLTSLADGNDEVENLVEAIEKLNIAIWQYGFHNLSPEVLGYLEKVNQLKNIEKQILGMNEELKGGLSIRAELSKLIEQIKKENESIQKLSEQSQEKSKVISANADTIKDATVKAKEHLTAIDKDADDATELVTEISELKKKSDDLTKNIENLSLRADEIADTITEQENTLTSLALKHKEMHKQVEDLLP